MKVLHVVPSYLPARRYGGPIRSVHGLARAQAAMGNDVNVFTTNVDGPGISAVPTGRPVDVDGVKVWYFPVSFGRRLYRSPAMAAALHGGDISPDIVHLHSVFLWPTMMAGRWATSAGIPYILTPRGMLVDDLIKRKNRVLKLAWITLFERRAIARAAAVHLTSNIERTEFDAMRFYVRHVEVIPNAVEASSSPCATIEGVEFSAPYVLFLGRINWKKGLDLLIRAMANVPGIKLVIAGNDEDNYQPHLKTLASEYNVASRVQFVDEVHDERKWALIRGASLLALTSYNENFGIVVLEAMSVGCPVIVTPEVGLADEVQSSGAGLVVLGNADAIAAGISGLLADPQRRKAMGEKGRVVSAIYSWESVAQKMQIVYARAIEESHSVEK